MTDLDKLIEYIEQRREQARQLQTSDPLVRKAVYDEILKKAKEIQGD